MEIRVRTAESEVEARLEPVQKDGDWAKAHGKIERKTYKDGVHRLKVKVSRVPLPDGTKLQVLADERALVRLVLKNGRARHDAETRVADHIPALAAGENVRVTRDGKTVLEGSAYSD